MLDVRLVEGPDGERDVLEVNLNQLDVSGGTRLKLAVAQIVFTATDLADVRGVRFLLNGSPVAVPLDDGESETGAIVTKADQPWKDFKDVLAAAKAKPGSPLAREAERYLETIRKARS